MTDCPLIQLDNGKWHCPVCDPDKRRLLPVKARRNCRKNGQPYQQSRGLGDTIAKMTKAVGIKPCGGCKERQKKLNELFPYKEKV